MLQVKLFFNWINIVASTSFRGTNSRNYNFKTDSYISEMGDVYSIDPSLEVTILNDYFNIEEKLSAILLLQIRTVGDYGRTGTFH